MMRYSILPLILFTFFLLTLHGSPLHSNQKTSEESSEEGLSDSHSRVRRDEGGGIHNEEVAEVEAEEEEEDEDEDEEEEERAAPCPAVEEVNGILEEETGISGNKDSHGQEREKKSQQREFSNDLADDVDEDDLIEENDENESEPETMADSHHGSPSLGDDLSLEENAERSQEKRHDLAFPHASHRDNAESSPTSQGVGIHLRVKRVSRAGSSHRPRQLIPKNKGSSRAGDSLSQSRSEAGSANDLV